MRIRKGIFKGLRIDENDKVSICVEQECESKHSGFYISLAAAK